MRHRHIQQDCKRSTRSSSFVSGLRKCPKKIREKLSKVSLAGFDVRPWGRAVANRFRNVNETGLGPVPPTKPLRRFPCPYCQGPHAWSRELVAEPTPPRPKFNTPRPSDSIHAVSLSSNPTASTHLNATGSASSDSLMGISISVARQNSGMISILVRRPEDSPKNAIPMIASFDTECRGGNLISLRHFNRLREYGNVPFEPVDGEVELLQGEPVRLLGIARGLTWQLELGFKTYTSDFYIVDMLRYDALVGRDTIFKYELLQRGADYAHHLERQEARRRKRIE